MEEDEPKPLNVYGRSKLAGERAILAAEGHCFVFRTSWVYGARGQNFLLTILKLTRSRNEIRIVDDQFGAPTSSRMIAEVTATVLHQTIARKDRQVSGLFHLSARGVTSWCRFAQHAINQLRLKTRIIPIPAAEYLTVASRPSNSMLATSKLSCTFEVRLPSWEEALDQVLSELEDIRIAGLVGS